MQVAYAYVIARLMLPERKGFRSEAQMAMEAMELLLFDQESSKLSPRNFPRSDTFPTTEQRKQPRRDGADYTQKSEHDFSTALSLADLSSSQPVPYFSPRKPANDVQPTGARRSNYWNSFWTVEEAMHSPVLLKHLATDFQAIAGWLGNEYSDGMHLYPTRTLEHKSMLLRLRTM